MEFPCQKLTGVSVAFVSSKKSNEALISPLSSFQRKQDYEGFRNIARNVPMFHAINDMPIPFNPSRLDEGEGIEATLVLEPNITRVADYCSTIRS